MRAFKNENIFADYLDYEWTQGPVYEMLKIRVLDCRSNEIVPNARVKKVVLNGAYAIIKEYDENSTKAEDANKVKQSQLALNKLGFTIDNPTTSYDDGSYTAYKNYMASRFPDLSDEDIDFLMPGSPTDELMDHIINEYNGCFSTDENGFVSLEIPKDLLDAATTIEIGLRDYPILLEATLASENNSENNVLRDTDSVGGGTNYQIRWGNGTEASPNDVTQDTEWNGNWGWHMKKDDRITQFKVSLQISIKDSEGSFTQFDNNLLSPFYQDENSAYHLVIYAMQWSQPVWDGIDDGELGNGESNGIVYVQDIQYKNLNMHIVTDKAGNGADTNGNHIYTYGKTYGTTRHRYKHDFDIDSIDMMTGIEGTVNVFAIHSGDGQYLNGSSTGNYIKLICEAEVFNTTNNKRGIRYLHLHSSNNLVLNSSMFFKTGQIVAFAGRSGIPAVYPDHCHMDYGAGEINHQASILNNINEVDNYNRVCIPHYNLPLILPCIPERSNSITNCNFSDSNANYCWAAKELICPALSSHTNASSDSQQIRVIQAQLKSIGYYMPSPITASPTGYEMNNINNTKLKSAIQLFKSNNEITPVNSDITDDFLLHLNELAPIN